MMEKFLSASSNEDFLDHAYRHFFAREPDAGGRAHFLAAMAGGMTREAVLHAFIGSDEFAGRFNAGGATLSAAQRFAPEGHFYSPIPAIEEYRDHFERLALPEPDGIAVDEATQLAYAEKFAATYGELPFPKDKTEGHRYYLNNGAFNYFDGIALYSMIREFKPKRIVEVGSGYSSAAMIDTCERFLGGATDITFIEPYPETLHKCLLPQDIERYRVLAQKVQDVDLAVFQTLQANDILFIDSSHVAKFGSDFNHLLFKVLPLLNDGVVVHFHDIFRNFDYPREWLAEGRAWNEAYVLKAFLAHNRHFKILFFNDWIAAHHWDFLEHKLPLCTVQPEGSPFKNCGVSLWLQYRAGC
jgi:predicted O-methyltransferase YrrM